MKKSDLVDAIAGKANLPKGQVQQMVDDVFDLIAEGLARGEKIDLRGFGTFSVRESAARQGRNPQTGEALSIRRGPCPASSPARSSRKRSTPTRARALRRRSDPARCRRFYHLGVETSTLRHRVNTSRPASRAKSQQQIG